MFYLLNSLVIVFPLLILIDFVARGQGRIEVETSKWNQYPYIEECSLMSAPKPSGNNISSGLILPIRCGIGQVFSRKIL